MVMLPEKFKGEYKNLLKEYEEVVLKPTAFRKIFLIQRFKEEFNLSDNQISLLEKDPPF